MSLVFLATRLSIKLDLLVWLWKQQRHTALQKLAIVPLVFHLPSRYSTFTPSDCVISLRLCFVPFLIHFQRIFCHPTEIPQTALWSVKRYITLACLLCIMVVYVGRQEVHGLVLDLLSYR